MSSSSWGPRVATPLQRKRRRLLATLPEAGPSLQSRPTPTDSNQPTWRAFGGPAAPAKTKGADTALELLSESGTHEQQGGPAGGGPAAQRAAAGGGGDRGPDRRRPPPRQERCAPGAPNLPPAPLSPPGTRQRCHTTPNPPTMKVACREGRGGGVAGGPSFQQGCAQASAGPISAPNPRVPLPSAPARPPAEVSRHDGATSPAADTRCRPPPQLRRRCCARPGARSPRTWRRRR